METPRFREDKAADMSHRFIQHNGGNMNYLKLLKLLYIVERTALLRWGRSVTFDRFVSMPRGPVMSRTYNLIMEEPGPDGESIFHERISGPNEYCVTVSHTDPPLHSPLSQAEIGLIAEVFDQYGSVSKWDVSDLTHRFPEWEDPRGSSLDIPIRNILERNGKTEPEVESILSELDALAYAECVFA